MEDEVTLEGGDALILRIQQTVVASIERRSCRWEIRIVGPKRSHSSVCSRWNENVLDEIAEVGVDTWNIPRKKRAFRRQYIGTHEMLV